MSDKRITLSIDAMGGDHGPSVCVPAACAALQAHPSLSIILVGDEAVLRPLLKKHGAAFQERLEIHHATEQVAMDESPTLALRNKKNSSMRLAINLVKEGRAQACVSAGNTGALMATARFVLKTLSGIDRPALISLLPTVKSNRAVRMLDLGANVDCTPEQLYQFAIMASVWSQSVEGIESPSVGLLNVGAEDIKGNALVKETAALLSSQSSVNYAGYVEGDDIYKGLTDIIVCDGFVGNVALKTSEGLVKMMSRFIREGFGRNLLTKLVAILALPVLKGLKERFDPARYNGASLLGLRGVVVKSHGSASVIAFTRAIEKALQQAEVDVPALIGHRIAEQLQG